MERADIDLLKKALVKMGYTVYPSSGTKTIAFSKDGVSGTYRDNRLEFSYSQGQTKPDTDAIKRAYSEQVILAKAEAMIEEDSGWELTRDGDDWVMEHRPGYGATVRA